MSRMIVVLALLLSGCSGHKHLKVSPQGKYQTAWKCRIDGVDAKTGKPSLLSCKDAEGTRWSVKSLDEEN